MLTTQDQERLREAMHGSINYANRAPMFCSEGIEDGPPIIKPSRFGWMIWPAMVVFLGFIVVIAIASI